MGEEAIQEALEGTLEQAWELINQRIIDSVLGVVRLQLHIQYGGSIFNRNGPRIRI